jgi:hypothetical protein
MSSNLGTAKNIKQLSLLFDINLNYSPVHEILTDWERFTWNISNQKSDFFHILEYLYEHNELLWG